MGQRVRETSGLFNRMTPAQVLNSELMFKICSREANLSAMFPSIFELASCEYAYNVDSFLFGLEPASTDSEMTVVARDNTYLQIIKSIIPRSVISQNQEIPSSAPDRHDFAVSVGGALGLLGEQKVHDEEVAIKQLKDSVNPDVLADAFPEGHAQTFAFATTNAVIAIHSLSIVKSASGKVRPTTNLLRVYNCKVFEERVKFIEDLFKIISWLCCLHQPNQPGTLVPG